MSAIPDKRRERTRARDLPEPPPEKKPPEDGWRGVYPGHCINPETCRGYSHCPRNYSCVE